MPTLIDLESRIRSIALRASKFKIGKTSQHELDRLAQHSGFSKIEVITWSKYKKDIDYYEDRMIERFFNCQNCANKNLGSAARMPTTDTYILYVVYNLKRR